MKKLNLKFFIAFLFFSFSYFNILGSIRVDSLKTLIIQKKGEEKFKVLEQLANYYINNNLDSSIYFLSQLKKLATIDNNTKYEAIACSSMGLAHFYRGKYFEAEDCVKQAVEFQKQIGDTTNLADSYNVLAGIYGVSGQYSKSTKVLFEAIKIYEAQNDLTGIVKAYNNLGYLFMKLENYEKAQEYYEKALLIIDKNNITYNKGFLYSNLGICNKEFGKNKLAIKNYRLALNQYNKNSTLNAIPILYQSIGILYAFSLNHPDSAFFYFEKGIDLAQKYDTNSLVELYRSLGKLYSKQNKLQKSIDAYNRSLNAAVNNNDLEGQMQAHLYLSETNKALTHFSTALDHYEEYTILKDSINDKETKTAISRLNEKYENDKNKLLVEQLTTKQQHSRLVQIILIAGIVLLIVALAFILYGLAQRKKRARMEKSILENEVRYKNKELASHALMMMQKNRMLQTLYDSINEAAKAKTDELPRILNSIKIQIKNSIKSEKDWELFKLYFEQINKSFFKKLKGINPELTQHDIRLAALIKLRFNIKEAASVLNLSPNSIKGARSRLRSKLRLSGSDDLSHFIEQIE